MSSKESNPALKKEGGSGGCKGGGSSDGASVWVEIDSSALSARDSSAASLRTMFSGGAVAERSMIVRGIERSLSI